MKTRVCFAVAALVVASMGAPASGGDLLYSQPGGTASGQGIGFYSNMPGQYGGGDQRVADDFSLGSSASVQSLSFWGWSDDGEDFDLGSKSATTNIVSFVIEFFALDGLSGVPGTSLYSETIAVGATSPVADGGSWEYTANLSSSVSLAAGTMYGLSIAANLNDDDSDNGFVWENSNTGNSRVFADFANGNGWTEFDTGGRNAMAFELTGQRLQIIPLPPALSMGLFGLLGVAAIRRRAR